jgi:hypothetical protein
MGLDYLAVAEVPRELSSPKTVSHGESDLLASGNYQHGEKGDRI